MAQTGVVESYVDAWKQRDPEAIAAHFAPRGVRRFEFVVPPLLDEPSQRDGPAEIVKPIRALITAMADLSLDVLGRVESNDGGMLEWRHTGTHTGAWDRWTPQGERVEFSGVSVYRLVDAHIFEERIYFDPDLLIRNWVPSLTTLGRIGMTMWKQGRATKRARG
jgi:hypothetical protein